MNRVLSTIVIAAATTAASWAVKRWLENMALPAKPPKQLENWENEGGALAPQHAAVETSQVPR